MDVQVAPAVVVIERLAGAAGLVAQAVRRLDVDVDAADRVDEILGRIDPQDHIAVEPGNAEEIRDDGLGFFDAAVRLRLIDLRLRAVRASSRSCRAGSKAGRCACLTKSRLTAQITSLRELVENSSSFAV